MSPLMPFLLLTLTMQKPSSGTCQIHQIMALGHRGQDFVRWGDKKFPGRRFGCAAIYSKLVFGRF